MLTRSMYSPKPQANRGVAPDRARVHASIWAPLRRTSSRTARSGSTSISALPWRPSVLTCATDASVIAPRVADSKSVRASRASAQLRSAAGPCLVTDCTSSRSSEDCAAAAATMAVECGARVLLQAVNRASACSVRAARMSRSARWSAAWAKPCEPRMCPTRSRWIVLSVA